MFYFNKIYLPSVQASSPILGRTLPSLLDETCDRAPDIKGISQRQDSIWQSLSYQELQTAAEELAMGLLQEKINRGDKVAFLMHSDINFCLADFGSLLAGLIDVPIDLTQTLDNIVYILRHSEAKVLIVSDLDLLSQVVPYLWDTPSLQTVIVADVSDNWEEKRTQLLTCDEDRDCQRSELCQTSNSPSACLCIPMLLCQARQDRPCPLLPQCIQLFSLDEVRAKGKKLWNEAKRRELRSLIAPQDLATIVYIAGETGKPKGVMLTHENISADILTTFNSIPDLKPGATETVLSFLPLTHIFARALIYGHLNYGHSIYFSSPNRAVRDFKTVRPTLVATVPRLLEKVYQKILDRGSKLQGSQKIIFNWALQLAQSYELGTKPQLFYALQLKLADLLVFSQWRKPFGGRLKYFISGGAALRADLANILSAAGMTVLQGYGLTETSSVICCNRGELNRAGTVGLPIAGVEIAIAEDGEILVKAPYVMQGYYQDSPATKSVIDEAGWLHTGDLGEFTTEGFLTITGSKKYLFKLSTGKYIMPQPLENHLQSSPLVKQAVVVGEQRKFCAMLIFPNLERLSDRARAWGWHFPISELLQEPEIIDLYQTLIDEANEQLPSWSKVKQFLLLDTDFTVANGLLDANLKVCRAKVNEVFASEINALYGEESALSSEFRVSSTRRARSFATELSPLFRLIGKMRGLYSKFRTPNSELRTFSFKRLTRKITVKAKLSWRWLKNNITLPSTMPWKLEKTANSEELE